MVSLATLDNLWILCKAEDSQELLDKVVDMEQSLDKVVGRWWLLGMIVGMLEQQVPAQSPTTINQQYQVCDIPMSYPYDDGGDRFLRDDVLSTQKLSSPNEYFEVTFFG